MLALGCVVSPASLPLSGGCKSLWKASRTGAALQRRACYGAVVMRRKVRQVRCSEGEGKGEEGEEEWSLEGQVEKMLGREESKSLIEDLNAAVERVAKARRDLDALDEQQRRTALTESLMAADSLVEDCQRSVFAAELDAKNAEIALVRARAGSSIMDLEEEGAIDRDVERVESGKAAGVSGVVGALAGMPFFLAANSDGLELAVSAGIVFLSCCVFGLTYRYAVRRDLRNTQLKAGCVAAFALVRSLDAVRLLVALSPQNTSEQLLQGCIFFTESIVVFCFAAVSLEYCFWQGFVSPFPSKPR